MLSQQQLQQFDEDGFLFLPAVFTPDEAALLRAEADHIYRLDREEIWRESSGEARTAFAAHTYSEPFRRLGAHPRLVEPAMQVLDGPVYIHQYKITPRRLLMARSGSGTRTTEPGHATI